MEWLKLPRSSKGIHVRATFCQMTKRRSSIPLFCLALCPNQWEVHCVKWLPNDPCDTPDLLTCAGPCGPPCGIFILKIFWVFCFLLTPYFFSRKLCTVLNFCVTLRHLATIEGLRIYVEGSALMQRKTLYWKGQSMPVKSPNTTLHKTESSSICLVRKNSL